MTNPAIPYQDLTYKIIGAAMRVHNDLGPGLRELNYHRALSIALQEVGLSFEEEKPIEVTFEDQWIGWLYIDHFVENQVIVEEKALPHLLTDEEVAQVLTYMAATDASVGLLLNFGRNRLEHRRILPPKKFDDWRQRARRYAWRPAESQHPHPFIRSTSAVDSGGAL